MYFDRQHPERGRRPVCEYINMTTLPSEKLISDFRRAGLAFVESLDPFPSLNLLRRDNHVAVEVVSTCRE